MATPIQASSLSSLEMNTFTSETRRSPTKRPRTVPKSPPIGLRGNWNASGVAPKPPAPRLADAITPITNAMIRKITALSISRAWSGPYSSRPSCDVYTPRRMKMTATKPTIPAAHTNARLVTKRSRVPPRPGAPEAARARTAATQANHAMLIACNRIARTRATGRIPPPGPSSRATTDTSDRGPGTGILEAGPRSQRSLRIGGRSRDRASVFLPGYGRAGGGPGGGEGGGQGAYGGGKLYVGTGVRTISSYATATRITSQGPTIDADTRPPRPAASGRRVVERCGGGSGLAGATKPFCAGPFMRSRCGSTSSTTAGSGPPRDGGGRQKPRGGGGKPPTTTPPPPPPGPR